MAARLLANVYPAAVRLHHLQKLVGAKPVIYDCIALFYEFQALHRDESRIAGACAYQIYHFFALHSPCELDGCLSATHSSVTLSCSYLHSLPPPIRAFEAPVRQGATSFHRLCATRRRDTHPTHTAYASKKFTSLLFFYLQYILLQNNLHFMFLFIF